MGRLVGTELGISVGFGVKSIVGEIVKGASLGVCEGFGVGPWLGKVEGVDVGNELSVGLTEGEGLGTALGTVLLLGAIVGNLVGNPVGEGIVGCAGGINVTVKGSIHRSWPLNT